MRLLKIKQEKAPMVVTSNHQGHQLSVIDHDKPFNFIVGQLRERSKTYNDLPQLPISLQTIRKTPQRVATLSLQSMPQDLHRRTHQTARRDASAFREGSALPATFNRRLFDSHHRANHRDRQNGYPVSARLSWRAVRAADGKEAPQRQGEGLTGR